MPLASMEARLFEIPSAAEGAAAARGVQHVRPVAEIGPPPDEMTHETAENAQAVPSFAAIDMFRGRHRGFNECTPEREAGGTASARCPAGNGGNHRVGSF
jgi:hypothetical protein